MPKLPACTIVDSHNTVPGDLVAPGGSFHGPVLVKPVRCHTICVEGRSKAAFVYPRGSTLGSHMPHYLFL